MNDNKQKIQINTPGIKKKNQEGNLKMDFRVNRNQVIYINEDSVYIIHSQFQ